jgi:hypothetical protein
VEPAVTERAHPVFVWIVGPLLAFFLAVGAGRMRVGDARGKFVEATSGLSNGALAQLEAAPALAVADATWALGDAVSVKKMFRRELDRLPEGPLRARVLIRFGVFDTNPDGQAAVFAQACADDPRVCDAGLKPAAEREVKQRLSAPGNQLPPFLLDGHPPIAGAP